MVAKISHSLLIAICLIFVGNLSSCIPTVAEEPPFDKNELKDLSAKLSFSYVNLSDSPRLKVQFSFVAPRKRMYLRLPSIFLREDRLFDRIEDLKVSEGTLESYHQGLEEVPSIKVLTCEPSKRVTLSYLIRGNNAREALEDPESFQSAVIEPGYVRFVGAMALILPEALFSEGNFPITFEWNVPTDYSIYNSYGENKRIQEISTNSMKIRDALFLFGTNFRVIDKSVNDNPVNIVLHGEWDRITDEDFVRILTGLIKVQRDTWKDNNYPYFLISLRSVPGECRQRIKFGGTAHLNSFRAYIPKGCAMRPEIIHLFSHELMHVWIGKKIMHGRRNGHIDGKWFTEGVTDYYGRLMAYRAGLLSEDELFDTFNEDLIKYYTSRFRRITLNELVKRMYKKDYTNQSLEKIPYEQGEIIAWRLDKLIKKNSSFRKSLDDVIRDMLKIVDTNGGVKNFSMKEMEDIFDVYCSGCLRQEFEKIVHGSSIAPPSLEGCANEQKSKSFRIATAYGHRLVRFPEAGYLYSRPETSQCYRWLR